MLNFLTPSFDLYVVTSLLMPRCRPTGQPPGPTLPPDLQNGGETGGGGNGGVDGNGGEKHPDDGGGVVEVVPGGGGGVPPPEPLKAAVISAGAGADAAATRAAAVAGTMLGILAAASGLAWALYKFKPGLIAPAAGGAGRAGAGAPSAAAPLLENAGAGAPGGGAPGAGSGSGVAPSAPSGDVGTMPAAGYSSLKTGASGARGFGIFETSQTRTMTDSMAVGAAASPTSTMNRGIQTDVANGPMTGAAAGGAASSTMMQSTTVKNVYSSQQTDSSLVDGSVTCTVRLKRRENGGTAAAVPLSFMFGDPALCGSHPLVTQS